MGGALEWLILRLILWIFLPLVLVFLALGPERVRRGWHRAWDWLTVQRLQPEEILTVVLRQHRERIEAVRKALAQSEAAEADISRNIRQSRDNLASLEEKARQHVLRNDDLGAGRCPVQAEPGTAGCRLVPGASGSAAAASGRDPPPALFARIAASPV